jgi:hypothetical protein
MARRYTKHGLVKLEGDIKRRTRRGRSLVDRRTKAGKDAMKLREDLIREQGGLDELSRAQLLIIELLTRDVYLLNEQDVRIFRTLKESPQAQSSPKVLATMYGYRKPIAESLRDNVKILGLKIPPPKIKTLDEVLAGICDDCWRDRESIYLARKAKEAAADKKPLSAAQRAALSQARATRAAKLLKHLPATATFRVRWT